MRRATAGGALILLDQINAANVAGLEIAWRWTSPDHAVRAEHRSIDPSWLHEATPITVNGVLYTSTRRSTPRLPRQNGCSPATA